MPGPTELAIVLIIVLILFGAGRLPQVFEAFGEGIKKFREAQREGSDDYDDVTPAPKAEPKRIEPPRREIPPDDAPTVAEADELTRSSNS